MKKLLLTLALAFSGSELLAQLPTNSFAITSLCPASAGNPSILKKINTNGTLTTVGTIQEGSTPLILNALGYDNNPDASQRAAYGMQVVQPITINNFQTPPNLYKINLATAQATKIGAIAPPPVPPSSLFSFYLSQTLNFVGDGSPTSTYYVGAATFRYSIFTGRVDMVKLYVGTVPLLPVPSATATWRVLDISEPNTAAVVENFRLQVQAFISSGGSGPTPEGGIQDWVYDPFSGNLVSYLGQEFKYLTIKNPGTAPVATTTLIPAANRIPTPSAQDIGSMFTDKVGNVYVVTANSGTIFRVDRTTGYYTALSYPGAFGCSRGDAVSFAGALPLPVELISFSARPAPGQVALQWETASEDNTRQFTVQRSQDGLAWMAVATVAATNSAHGARYQARDMAPPTGQLFYRLAMEDLDGTRAYSPVETVTYQASAAWAAYPNPAHDFLLVEGTGGAGEVLLLNGLGQVVRRLPAPAPHTPLRIATAGLPAGLYYITARDRAGRAISEKIEVR
ncbi:hypothetical protein PK28_12300 [Hymenobacter sp. DG25B]|uniref:T9SS type A sorting domain-containing protein n=1 Tax=Hymenobacter sp. DG25B TaxID=1385664 RepID=UPI0005408BF2|nr:T9SS type A sorting domain-containing protein [Hymenobacter sp. DG25B]AIZ64270.1 hypothetical protein PK28_12300 [Hymenobacter sp. DG25B]